ncbi:conserved hypothetical protein [Zunongwangia profunda SM-A87]|uniref:TonB-dependent receptor n=1 Tax=Zunongwangia profunda (strain DSM 18752 / CCTCC AB 206139 / SM-A87) TaxID=655815 RepID=D5BGT9_ZUNPS|nr:carboxypeptidase-like regulatory domain-containing protein [Zunongwangia profunda]ADF53270.1 conserved hypothetical protein [Zunongwangia profunda SM-A87]
MRKVNKDYSTFLIAFALMLGMGMLNKINAQDFKTIAGSVTSEEGVALKGVNIFVPNTSFGSVTDAEGNFELQIPEDSKVVLTYIGFETKTIDVSKTTDFQLKLEKEKSMQEDTIIVSYNKDVGKPKSRILKIE